MSLRLAWVAALICVACLLLILSPALGRWKEEYAQVDQATRDWYQRQVLTPEAQAVFNFSSCCAHSDVVKTQFRVDRSTGADQWWWLDGDTWKRIPDYAIHWGQAAPGGQPVMFAVSGRPTCFFPPDAGG